MLGKTFSAVNEKTSKLATTLNFSINRKKLSQHISEIRKSPLKWDEHAGIYIGKMLANPLGANESIYTSERLEGMLLSALHDTKNEGIVHIYLCPILYELLGDEDYKKPILSFEEQKDKIYSIAKKAKIPATKIKIHNIYDNHKELFDNIKSYGPSTLNTGEVLQPKDFSSYELARFFYTLSQKYPLIKNDFTSLLADGLKEELEDGDPLEYYGMLECAFRIADNANGITTQGGLLSQKKFDFKIKSLLSGKTGIKELDEFAVQAKEQGIQMHDRRYFKHGEYDDELKKLTQKNKTSNKIRNIIVVTSIAIASAIGGGYGVSQFQEWGKEKKDDTEFIEKINKQKKYYDIRSRNGDANMSGEQLLSSWNDSWKKKFQNTYGISNPKKLKYDFLGRYAKKHYDGTYYASQHGSNYNIQDVIDRYIFERKDIIESFLNIKVQTPRERFSHFEDQFINTLELSGKEYKNNKVNPYRTTPANNRRFVDNYGTVLRVVPINNTNAVKLFNEESHRELSKYEVDVIIQDFFTPTNTKNIVTSINNYRGVLGEDILQNNFYRDDLKNLELQGFNIDYTMFENAKYNQNCKIVLATFFGEKLRAKKQGEYEQYNKQKEVADITRVLCTEYMYNDKQNTAQTVEGSRSWNKLYSQVFNLYILDQVEIKNNSDIEAWIFKHLKDFSIEKYTILDGLPGRIYHPTDGIIGGTIGIGSNSSIFSENTHGFIYYISTAANALSQSKYITINQKRFQYGTFGKSNNGEGYIAAVPTDEETINSMTQLYIDTYCPGDLKNEYSPQKLFKKVKEIMSSPNTFCGYYIAQDYLKKQQKEIKQKREHDKNIDESIKNMRVLM